VYKVPPPEFAPEAAQADVPVPSAPAPIVASLAPSASSLPPPPPVVVSPPKGAANAIATITIPLQQSASNTTSSFSVSSSLASLVKKGAGEKESADRHVSPAPLGTADSNVPPVINAAAVVSNPAKAVKRGAAPGVTAGEKRKKALKRL